MTETIRQFVDNLAARTPTPGGGAASAHAAEMGVALFLMAVRFSVGKSGAEADASLQRAERTLQSVLQHLEPMADRDMSAFERVMAAYRLPKDKAEVRQRAIQEAMHGAMVVPEEMMCLVRDALVAVDDVIGYVGRNIICDLGAGAALLDAAASTAHSNVRINASFLDNRDVAGPALDRAIALREETVAKSKRIARVVDDSIGTV